MRSDTAARKALAERRYGDAAARAVEARALFGDGEAAARRQAAADADRAREAEAERARAAQAERARAAEAERARTAERRDPVPLPPPAPPAAAAPPAPTGPTAEQSIATVITRYVAALEARDLNALRQVWPGLGGAQEAAIKSDFENARSIDASFANPTITVSGATATATGLRRYALRTRDGHRLQGDTMTTITLRQAGGQWVIDSMRHQPAR